MKKSKKLVAFAMALVCVFSLLGAFTPQSQVMAASTKSVTLVAGEVTSYRNYFNTVASCSVKNKSIATVKKDPKDSKSVIVSSKKAGTTTVTVKYKGGSIQKLTVKVVKPNFTVKTVGETDNYVFFSVKNSTKIFFDTLAIKYVLKTADGEVMKQDVERVYKSTPGSTIYFSVHKGYDNNISRKKCSAKVVPSECSRYFDYTYTDRTSKVKVTKEKSEDGLKLKWRNNFNDYVNAAVDIVFYDEAGHIVNIESSSKYMSSNEIDTSNIYISKYLEYDHNKMFVRAYSEKYNR